MGQDFLDIQYTDPLTSLISLYALSSMPHYNNSHYTRVKVLSPTPLKAALKYLNPNSIGVKYSFIVLGGGTPCLCFDLLIGEKLC